MAGADLLHRYFERAVDSDPDRVAVAFECGEVSYGELDGRANRLAHRLRASGVGPGSLVGIYLRKSVDAYASLLGVLKAGAAYVPIDPAYPSDRVIYILENSRARALVTTADLKDRARPFNGTTVVLDDPAALTGEWPKTRPADLGEPPSPTDLCYVIYTSGSTGRPKGVEVEHRNACALVAAEREVFQVSASDRVAQTASLSFDLSVEEIWLAFAACATLVPLSEEVGRAGPDVGRFLQSSEVTVLSCVPSLLAMVDTDLPRLRLLIVGGEVCPDSLVERWARPGRRMVNTYGPTETTVTATYADLRPGERVLLGRPLPGYTLSILDDAERPVPVGDAGEICIGGGGVARGYVDRPEETAKRFVPVPGPEGSSSPERIYRSGDLGRLTPSGELEFLGRADGQVKIRGYRVELAEIESVLMQQEGVLSAACTLREDRPGFPLLVGYVVPRNGTPLDAERLRQHLLARLPRFMVPSLLETLPDLPRLPSGKLDRSALPAPRPRAARGRPPRGPLERRIADVWNSIFEPLTVGVDDDFFLDLGGHSLLAARMVSELRKEARLSGVSLADVYEHPTVASLAAEIRAREGVRPQGPTPGKDGARAPPPPASLPRRMGISLAQGLGLYLSFAFRALEWVTPFLVFFLVWLSGQTILAATLWAVLSAVVVFPALLGASLVAKWLILGRIRPGRHPLWGGYYLRWWFVQSLASAVPLDYLDGTPLLPFVLRLYGARVGKNVHLETSSIAAYDLVTIGDGACIDEDASLLGYTVERGELVLEPIEVGPNCYVGTRAVLREGSRMGARSRLEDLSLLPQGEQIPAGETWAGSPARRSTSLPQGLIPEPPPLGRLRRLVTPLAYVGMVLVIPVLLFAAIAPGLLVLVRMNPAVAPLPYLLAVPLVGASFVMLLMGELVVLKWLLVGRVRPGSYRVDGSFYMRNWLVDQLHSLSLDLVAPIHATLYVGPWYRALGARVGRHVELSTATSTTPDLLELGDGATIADEVSLGSAHVEGGWMTVAPTRLGSRAFVGNSAVIPAGTELADGSLCGVLSLPPPSGEGPVRPGSSWLGSPAIELPRRQHSEAFSEERTYQPPQRLRVLRRIVETLRVTIPPAGFIAVTVAVLGGTLALWSSVSPLAALALLPVIYAGACFAVALTVAGAKWAIVGRYRPFEKPLWSGFVWRLEFVNALYEFLATPLALEPLQGTLFLPGYLRLLGVRIGKGVYVHTTGFLEWDLTEVGDAASLNEDCVMQSHLFEDRVLKASHLRIGPGCNVGAYSVVLYGSEMEEGARLDSLSLLMKGETLPSSTSWAGIPARRAGV